MIMDKYTEFADAVSVAAAAGTALIGDVIDLEAARDIGAGSNLYLVIQVDTEIITGGVAGTVQFKLASDAQAAIAVDGSATVHASTAVEATGATTTNANLEAGSTLLKMVIPLEGPTYERYLGILCVTATTTTTAGAINAFLTPNPSAWKAIADATN